MKYTKKYADLLLNKGVDLKPGEDLLINAPLEARDLVFDLTTLAYQKYQSHTVHVNYQDINLSQAKLAYAPDTVLSDVPNYVLSRYDTIIKRGGAVINITSSFPHTMKTIDPKRIAKAAQLSASKVRPFEQQLYKTCKWTLAAYPSDEWAQSIYQNISLEDARQNLEEALIAMLKLNKDDPINAWSTYLDTVNKRVEALNNYQFKTIHFMTGDTDITIDLPDDHQWLSLSHEHKNGIFLEGLPAERIFTSPHKYGANGTIKLTKPMVVRGTTINPFELTFKDGKITKLKTTKQDEQIIKRLLSIDEGAAYLGEISLIEPHSMLDELNTTFNHRLLDQTKGSYLTLGNANRRTLKSSRTLNKEGLLEAGLNQSKIRLDLTIHKDNLDVTGITKDGTSIPLMEDGTFLNIA
ncbi:MAG: aminopeptidase [Bacillota bacterium]